MSPSRPFKVGVQLQPHHCGIDELRTAWQADFWGIHTIDWWRRLWQRTGLVEVQVAELLPESELIKQEWMADFRGDPAEAGVVALLEAEGGTFYGEFRLVGKRTSDITSIVHCPGCFPSWT